MGEVYEATHARLAGRYAVKMLWSEIASAEVFARFKREALVTSSLRHPNIVQVIDFNRTAEGVPYLVMEYLEGIELAAELRRGGAMLLPRVVNLIEQTASALAAAHKRGIIHRDLKPQNLFLTYVEGHSHELVKVLDFGISKVREATNPLTRESTLMGTPQYMSPEQAQGMHQEVDVHADQFALAVITYELLSGRCPFRGDSVPAVVYQVVYETPAPLSTVVRGVNEEVAAVVARGMAKQKEARFPSVMAFSRALSAAAAGMPEPDPLYVTGPVQTIVDQPVTLPQDLLTTTTLGTSSGETIRRPLSHPRPRRWPVVALFAVALLGAGLSVKHFAHHDAPATPAPPPVVEAAPVPWPRARPVEPAPAPPVETVLVQVENGPPDLTVQLDGEVVEPPIRLPRGPEAHVLRFEAPDYKSYELKVDGKKNRAIRLTMVKRRKQAGDKMLLDF
jgi:serine/threonine-protein kinase